MTPARARSQPQPGADVPSANGHGPPSVGDLVGLLEERIRTGALTPGAKLPSERELALHYDVSRPVVREALRSLQERGSIEIRPSRGAFVRAAGSFDLAGHVGSFAHQRGATARDLIRVRAMLEEEAARLAASNATPEQVRHLAALVDAMDDARDLIDRARCDIAFHSLLATSSGNPVIEIMFGSISPLVFEQIIRGLGDRVVAEAGEPLHRVVAEAVAARDADAAGAAMRRHVMLAEQLFGADLDAPLEHVARRKVDNILGGAASLEEVVDDVLGGLAR